jgi:hypothetical protein
LYLDCLSAEERAPTSASSGAEIGRRAAGAENDLEARPDALAEPPSAPPPARAPSTYVMLCHYGFHYAYGCAQIAWGEQLRFVAPGGSGLVWLQQLSSGVHVCVPDILATELVPWGCAALGSRAMVALQYAEPPWLQTSPTPRFEVGDVVVLMEHVTHEMSMAFVRKEAARLPTPVRVPLMILTFALSV